MFKLRLCTGRTAHRESRGIALFFLDHGSRRGWGVSVMPRPLSTSRKDLVRIVQEALGAPQGRSGQVWKISPPIRFRSPDIQPLASRYTDWATQPVHFHWHHHRTRELPACNAVPQPTVPQGGPECKGLKMIYIFALSLMRIFSLDGKPLKMFIPELNVLFGKPDGCAFGL